MAHWNSSYTREMQKIVDRYRKSGGEWPASAREIAVWAIANGWWEITPGVATGKCAEDISRAMREQYIRTPDGRAVRALHPARMRRGDKQLMLWEDIRTGPRKHFEAAFQLRRSQITADCAQLRTDVDYYNERSNPGEPIQLVLDFTNDVEEAEALRQAS